MRLATLLIAFALFFAAPAHADEHEEHAVVLQLTAGAVGGLLVSGYAFAATEQLRLDGSSPAALAPLPFAAGAGLAVWLIGRWRGLRSDAAGTWLGVLLPTALGLLTNLASEERGAPAIISFVATPVLTLAGAVAGFEIAREPDEVRSP